MAEDEIATKAPETDAQGSLVSGDTPAQEGASMGVRPQTALRLRVFTDLTSKEHCVTDRPSRKPLPRSHAVRCKAESWESCHRRSDWCGSQSSVLANPYGRLLCNE